VVCAVNAVWRAVHSLEEIICTCQNARWKNNYYFTFTFTLHACRFNIKHLQFVHIVYLYIPYGTEKDDYLSLKSLHPGVCNAREICPL
jgi:hypothetical protein